MTDLRKLVESIVKEHFDDDVQKRAHDYIDFENPYSSDVKGLHSINKFQQNNLAKSSDPKNGVDAKTTFSKHVVPVIKQFPQLSQIVKLEAKSPDEVVMSFDIGLRNKKSRIKHHLLFRFVQGKTTIKYVSDTYYFKNQITPEDENIIENDPEVSSFSEIGDIVKFTYRPFEKLSLNLLYNEPIDDKNKLVLYINRLMSSIGMVFNQLGKSDLP